MTRPRSSAHPRPPLQATVPTPLSFALAALLTLAALLLAPAAAAQGAPSGEYGPLPLGGSVDGTIAAIQGDEVFVYNTYTVAIPPGTAAVTVRVDGLGSDLDLALKLGAPIVDYNDVDFIDTSEDPNPVHTLATPNGGTLFIDVLNLLPAPANYRLTVTAGAAGAPGGGGAAPPAAPGGNPLAPGGGANPLAPGGAPTDPLLGEFEGSGLRVRITGGGGSYSGELVLGGQSYPFQASGGNGSLEGSFTSGGASFPFTASLAGDTLTVVSGGSTYVTQRLGGAPANPLGGGAAPNPNDPVLAQGAHGALTQDNALAFIEALEFSLLQVGYAQTVSDADRAQMLQAIAQEYPALDAPQQAVLTQAREVWTRVQANWAAAAPAEQEQFVIGVFVLAFGEEAVQQALASNSAGGSGSSGGSVGCDDIDACMSRYGDPEDFQDTMNAQGCWAAAGCESYDAGTNTFSYDSFDSYSDY